jgi:hypothetical protein
LAAAHSKVSDYYIIFARNNGFTSRVENYQDFVVWVVLCGFFFRVFLPCVDRLTQVDVPSIFAVPSMFTNAI